MVIKKCCDNCQWYISKNDDDLGENIVEVERCIWNSEVQKECIENDLYSFSEKC